MEPYLWKGFDYRGSGVELLEALRGEPHLFFLDSSRHDPLRGRYSFIGVDPFDVFVHKGREALDLLKKKFYRHAGRNSSEFAAPFSSLTSGIVGCLGYDYGVQQEKIKRSSRDDLMLPDAWFGFYDVIITIDHFTRELYISSSGLPEKSRSLRKKRALERLEETSRKLAPYLEGRRQDQGSCTGARLEATGMVRSNISREAYMDAVRKALDHIARGDIYQVNLSQRFECDGKEGKVDPVTLYKNFRELSPVPFGGYMDAGDFVLISNSPERFLRLQEGVVQTRPMKGTRPRGENALEDERLRREIENSAKEKAELLMITDLLRNDLGRVCAYGSVRVREMRAIEEYPYVFQATAAVEGVLAPNKDCFDLIRACFPGGSITGCPKIRAMEIIEELEPVRRGMYTGSMGYISFDGNMDWNILIRTLVCSREKLYFQVGGGIVADSIPEKEYEETLVKAAAFRALLGCGGTSVGAHSHENKISVP